MTSCLNLSKTAKIEPMSSMIPYHSCHIEIAYCDVHLGSNKLLIIIMLQPNFKNDTKKVQNITIGGSISY
jgi:hypothetical protein